MGKIRVRRWARTVVATSVLSCVAMLASAGSARGAVVVFVDPAGLCAGFAPCFTTIQQGINNAGPPPAVVNVFPADYAESADVGLLGSLIGEGPGDLILRTVNAAGVPTPGTARIMPATGPALRNSVNPYIGNISVDGFTLRSPDDFGIRFATVQGTVAVSHIVADANGGGGLFVLISGGDMRISDSSFSNNTGDDGINFGTAVNVTFERVTADGNSADGASFGLTGDLRITDSSFSNNTGGDGLSFGTAVDVTFDEVTANGNDSDGASFGLTGDLRITHSTFSSNLDGNGLSFATAINVTFDWVTADGNNRDGASFGIKGDLRITNSTFSSNLDGSGLSFGNTSNVTFSHVTANGNSADGASFDVEGGVHVSRSRFEGNGAAGFRMSAFDPAGIFLLNCSDIARNANGLVLVNPATVQAPENFWGAASGPTHPSNPLGMGDSIIDGANGGAGTVNFQPFLTLPASESAQCVARPTPALGSIGLAILVLALFALPARRLLRARGAARG